jgi:hypothetical protein
MADKILTDKFYKLKGKSAPLSHSIPSRSNKSFSLLYFDEKTGTNRPLRYSPNQKSPFEDEQDGNVVLEPIVFTNGTLMVPKQNQVLQSFLHYHPFNGTRFEEINNERDAEKEVEDINSEADALISARGMEVEELEMIGRVLFNKDVTMMTTAELRRDILVFAKRNPKDFLSATSDPQIVFKAKLQRFFDEKLLTFRKQKKEVWYSLPTNRTKMLEVPFGKDPMYIVGSFLSSDEGLEQLKFLEDTLENL